MKYDESVDVRVEQKFIVGEKCYVKDDSCRKKFLYGYEVERIVFDEVKLVIE